MLIQAAGREPGSCSSPPPAAIRRQRRRGPSTEHPALGLPGTAQQRGQPQRAAQHLVPRQAAPSVLNQFAHRCSQPFPGGAGGRMPGWHHRSAPGSHCACPHTSTVALGAAAGPRAVPSGRHRGAEGSRLPLAHPGMARNIRAGQDTQLSRNSTRLSSHPHPALHTRHTHQRAHWHSQLHVRPAPNEGAQTRTEPCTHPQPCASTRTHTCTQTRLYANAGWGTRAPSALLLRPALPTMQILPHHANPQLGALGAPWDANGHFGAGGVGDRAW